jgi:SprT protein
MSKKEAPLDYLKQYIPEGSAELVLGYLNHYRVHLTITRERASVLGDYRHATHFSHHRISVNGNLNKFAFLITLLHELAHLITFMEHGNRPASHGREWKAFYRELLQDSMKLNVFPPELLRMLKISVRKPPATSCADEDLLRVLRIYDGEDNTLQLVEDLAEGSLFQIHNGKIYRKGRRIRKRFECLEIKTGKLYLFSPVHEVKAVTGGSFPP